MPKKQFPLLSRNGWHEMEGCLAPVQCTKLPEPQAVTALVKCGSQGYCIKTSCSCSKNGIDCTSLCKCVECENTKRL